MRNADGLGLAEPPKWDLTSDPVPPMLLGQFFSDGRVIATFGCRQRALTTRSTDPFDVDAPGSLQRSLQTEAPLRGSARRAWRRR